MGGLDERVYFAAHCHWIKVLNTLAEFLALKLSALFDKVAISSCKIATSDRFGSVGSAVLQMIKHNTRCQ